MTRGIFIDFDNTMMDTEKHSLPSLIQRFNDLYGDQLDTPLTLEEFTKHFHGLARESLCTSMSALYGITVVYEDLFAHRDTMAMRYLNALPNGIDVAPFLVDILSDLYADGWTPALVTNNTLQRCCTAMQVASDRADGVALAKLLAPHYYEGGFLQKPDPDVYVRAIAGVDADPKRSCAVEDSPAGVTAATKAGLICLGFTGFSATPDALGEKLLKAGASALFHTWDELPDLLRTHNL